MSHTLEISLLGELRIKALGEEVPLPASRKARALLAFLIATGRPHRRERLCELFWDIPDDPKAALRWALSKLRRAVDSPERLRIIADRERVRFDAEGIRVDILLIHARLRDRDNPPSLDELEEMAAHLGGMLLDGLDGAGDEAFDAWLTAEREDVRVVQVEVHKRLATHPQSGAVAARKWLRLWREEDPDGAAAYGRSPAHNRPAERDPDPAALLPALGAGRDEIAFRPTDAEQEIRKARSEALRAQRIGFCEVADGTKIAYASIGSGPPILKAANWLNHLEFDWSSPIWGSSFAELANRRTFIRYDERGCGLSDWEVKDLSFGAFVEDLEAVADTLGLDRFPLLGISQGCAVSVEYAVRHPERVTALILISGYAAGWRHLASPEEQARREAVLTLTELGWGTDNPAYRHIFSQTFMPDASAETLAWFDEFQRLTTSPKNAARFQDAFGHIDVRHRLREVRTPTIVLHSRYDQRIPLELGKAVADGIPGAEFAVLDSRNHILVDREPAWQVCVTAINAFLKKHGI